jgi:glycosyltransferase involved in cell wall biosynthesis
MEGDASNAVAPLTAGGRLDIGLLGTLQPRKGQLQAIEAIGLLKERCGIDVRLHLYGYNHFFPDYLAACREMAARYGVSDLVSFPGFVIDTVAAMRELDAVICASAWESLPQAILEAMAAGRLVMAPNVGGIAEVVSRRTGILMPDNTAASISRALTEVLGLSPESWREKVNLAREVAFHECSRYSVSTELFRLYRRAAAGQSRRIQKCAIPREHYPTADDGAPQFAPDATGALELLRSRLREINSDMQLAE